MIDPEFQTSEKDAREATKAYQRTRTRETRDLGVDADAATAQAVKAAYPGIMRAIGMREDTVSYILAGLDKSAPGNHVAWLQKDIASRMLHLLRAADAGKEQEAAQLRTVMSVAATHKLSPFRDLGMLVNRNTSHRLRHEFGPRAA